MKYSLGGASALLTMMKAMSLQKSLVVKPTTLATKGKLLVYVHPKDFKEARTMATEKMTTEDIFTKMSQLAALVSTIETTGKAIDIGHAIAGKGLKTNLKSFVERWVSGDGDGKMNSEEMAKRIKSIEKKVYEIHHCWYKNKSATWPNPEHKQSATWPNPEHILLYPRGSSEHS